MEVSGQLHAPTAVPWGKNSGTHWIGSWGGAQNRCGRGGKEKKSLSLLRIEPRSLNCSTFTKLTEL